MVRAFSSPWFPIQHKASAREREGKRTQKTKTKILSPSTPPFSWRAFFGFFFVLGHPHHSSLLLLTSSSQPHRSHSPLALYASQQAQSAQKNWEAQARTNSILAGSLKALEERVDDCATLLDWCVQVSQSSRPRGLALHPSPSTKILIIQLQNLSRTIIHARYLLHTIHTTCS